MEIFWQCRSGRLALVVGGLGFGVRDLRRNPLRFSERWRYHRILIVGYWGFSGYLPGR